MPTPTRRARRSSSCTRRRTSPARCTIGHCAAALARGRARPLAPDARLQHALPARLRPRRASRRWASIERQRSRRRAGRQRDLGRDGFDALRPGVARALRRRDHEASSAGSAPRSTTGATRFTMDEGYVPRRACAGSSTSTSAAGSTGRTGSSTGARATRPRSPTSRSSTRTTDDTLSYVALPARRRLRPRHDRDRAAGDDPRRRRGRRASGRRALPRARRQGGRRPVRRAARAGHRRRARRAASSAQARSRSRPATTRLDFEIGRDHGLPELTVIGPRRRA